MGFCDIHEDGLAIQPCADEIILAFAVCSNRRERR
jgi:hypothetical protein